MKKKGCTLLNNEAILTHDGDIVYTRTDIFKISNDCKECENKVKEQCAKKLKEVLLLNKKHKGL